MNYLAVVSSAVYEIVLLNHWKENSNISTNKYIYLHFSQVPNLFVQFCNIYIDYMYVCMYIYLICILFKNMFYVCEVGLGNCILNCGAFLQRKCM